MTGDAQGAKTGNCAVGTAQVVVNAPGFNMGNAALSKTPQLVQATSEASIAMRMASLVWLAPILLSILAR